MRKSNLKRFVLTSAIVLAVISLTACAQKTPSATPSIQHSTNNINTNNKSSISVSGNGQVHTAPDMAVVRIGAIVQDQHAQNAQGSVNTIVNRIIKSLVDMGVAKKRIQTASITLNPIYQKDDTTSQTKVVSYRASNTIKINVIHLNRIGQIISQSLKDGANNIQGISYQLQDDTKAKNLALDEAVKQAQQKAQTVARSLGMHLTNVKNIQVGSINTRWFSPQRAVAQTLSASYKGNSTPTQPGQVEIGANVSITFGLSK